ncbi:hypothetical protein E2562_024762 [Oryza meyeriana var. granulata]|uniref:Uncharacterized protein n=1 Tax=Oryza meyeriana var. granulata TaxID=110450 RepID=A0A6G1FBS8_9ORYZ|nr:hypothetical protein E2562_024762 [Oryza meyeriana var. granulata]
MTTTTATFVGGKAETAGRAAAEAVGDGGDSAREQGRQPGRRRTAAGQQQLSDGGAGATAGVTVAHGKRGNGTAQRTATAHGRRRWE